MTSLVRWEPFLKEFNTLARRFDRMFESGRLEREGEDFGHWHPLVDIVDKGSEINLQAELPGMKKEDIEILVENNVLTLRGQKSRSKEIKEEGHYRSEREYGSFARSFTLPTTVDVKRIEAKFVDGVLSVTLPKTEEAKPRQISVKIT